MTNFQHESFEPVKPSVLKKKDIVPFRLNIPNKQIINVVH